MGHLRFYLGHDWDGSIRCSKTPQNEWVPNSCTPHRNPRWDSYMEKIQSEGIERLCRSVQTPSEIERECHDKWISWSFEIGRTVGLFIHCPISSITTPHQSGPTCLLGPGSKHVIRSTSSLPIPFQVVIIDTILSPRSTYRLKSYSVASHGGKCWKGVD